MELERGVRSLRRLGRGPRRPRRAGRGRRQGRGVGTVRPRDLLGQRPAPAREVDAGHALEDVSLRGGQAVRAQGEHAPLRLRLLGDGAWRGSCGRASRAGSGGPARTTGRGRSGSPGRPPGASCASRRGRAAAAARSRCRRPRRSARGRSGRSPEIPCDHSARDPLRRGVRAPRRARARRGPAYSREPASVWNRCASSAPMPAWCSCTWACVQASVATRSNVVTSWYLSARSRHGAPGRRHQRRERHADRLARAHADAAPEADDRVEHRAHGVGEPRSSSVSAQGVRTLPPSPEEAARGRSPTRGRRSSRPPPRGRGRARPRAPPATAAAAWRAACPAPATISVWTNRFENARWAASAAAGASTTSAYEVTSISRVRAPWFVIDTRRTSASSSDDTITSRRVEIAPSRRDESPRGPRRRRPRSSPAPPPLGWNPADQRSPLATSRRKMYEPVSSQVASSRQRVTARSRQRL